MSDHESVAGKLLLATPLTGDFFKRSVVLVLHHDEEGAHGLTLNRPLDAAVSAVLPDWEPHVTPPHRLFQGGPVGMDTAMGLVSIPGDGPDSPLGTSRLFGSLGLVDLDAPPALVVPEVTGLRIFAGYAGWGEGQLDDELDAGAWFVVEAEPRDPFQEETAGLWRTILARQRSSIALVSTYPDDPERN